MDTTTDVTLTAVTPTAVGTIAAMPVHMLADMPTDVISAEDVETGNKKEHIRDPRIAIILDDNIQGDLKRLLRCRCIFNISNIVLVYHYYGFYLLGIFLMTLSDPLTMPILRYFGMGINVLAFLCRTYVDVNTLMMKRMQADIVSIRNGTYIDEGVIATIENKD
jgi:hypothetical protein